MNSLQTIIEQGFEQRFEVTPHTAKAELIQAVDEVLRCLDSGQYRIAEKINDEWVVHQWLKKAVLLSFKLYPNEIIDAGFCQFYDKVPLKYQEYSEQQFQSSGVRIVPHAMVRRGAYIAKNTVLMPSYVNVGAYVDEGVLIDTWATVGSCAQIGKKRSSLRRCRIGGVLEPLQANPTIIEDNCFIGARSEVVEGVIVERDSVISMGVFLGQSTKIYNRLTGTITYGRIPAGSVVVAGSLPSEDKSHSLYCAVIVKQIDEKTRAKVSINELLRANE